MDAPQPPDPDADADASDGADLATLVFGLIGSRQSVAPKRLRAPGPDGSQVRQLVEAALCAPDHRGLKPWRLVRIADHQRDALADLFEACARDRDPPAQGDDDIAKSRDKAYRAPVLLLAVLKHEPPDPEVPLTERAVTLGGALMAMLLAAHGLGYGAMLTSGRAVRTARFASAFRLADDEQAVCFISIGSTDPTSPPRPRPRGSAHERLSDWQARAAERRVAGRRGSAFRLRLVDQRSLEPRLVHARQEVRVDGESDLVRYHRLAATPRAKRRLLLGGLRVVEVVDAQPTQATISLGGNICRQLQQPHTELDWICSQFFDT